MVVCLEQGADCLHMVQLMPLHPKTPSFLASFRSRLVFSFWYWLTQLVPEKRPSNGWSSSSSFLECPEAIRYCCPLCKETPWQCAGGWRYAVYFLWLMLFKP